MPRALLAVVVILAITGSARAQSLDLAGGAGGGHAIGRAGAGVVGADDGSAIWLNPAGLARRGGWRAQLGLGFADQAAQFTTSEVFGALPAADAREQGEPARVPWLALQGSVGERVVFGVAYLEPTDLALAWPAPDPLAFDEDDDDRDRYPGRYAGDGLHLERRGVGVGASVRATPWLAVGASVWLLGVDARQTRTIWGGLGVAGSVHELSPAFDLRFDAHASGLQVGGALGVIVVPPDAPVELGASVSFTQDADLDGTPALGDSRGTVTGSGARIVTATVDPGAAASLTLPSPLVVRAGARFLLPRATLELDGELARGGAATPTWRVTGVTLTHFAGPTGALGDVPVGASLRDGYALRAALDVDVVPGFLVVAGGYAFTRAAVRRSSVSPALPLLDSHTLALGASLYAGGFTISFGVAHALGGATTTTPGEATVIAPLASGAPPAAAGTYDGSSTLVGVGVELEL